MILFIFVLLCVATFVVFLLKRNTYSKAISPLSLPFPPPSIGFRRIDELTKYPAFAEAMLIAYEKRGDLKGDDGTMYSYIGLIYAIKGMHAKAIKACQEAIKINPDMHLPYLITGNAYFFMNMCDEALDIINSGIKRGISHAPLYILLACALHTTGQIKEALSACKKALKLDPKNVDACAGMAFCYLTLHNLRKAKLLARKAVDMDPANASARYSLGAVFLVLGKIHEAIRQQEVLEFIDPHTAYILSNAISKQKAHRE